VNEEVGFEREESFGALNSDFIGKIEKFYT